MCIPKKVGLCSKLLTELSRVSVTETGQQFNKSLSSSLQALISLHFSVSLADRSDPRYSFLKITVSYCITNSLLVL